MTEKHRLAIEKELWQRDYELVAEHHPTLLDEIELAIRDGVDPIHIKRWVMGVVDEPLIIQRVFNAARYCEAK